MMRTFLVGTVLTLAATVVPQLHQTEPISAMGMSHAGLLARPIHMAVAGHKQDTTVSFARDVRSILERSCTECHGGGESVEMGLDLTSYDGLMAGSDEGTVVEPGKPDESYLIDMVKNGDMPEEGNPLTPEEIDILRKWIASGALNN